MLLFSGFDGRASDLTDKWIARSAFQKSVRRGNGINAAKFGIWLYKNEPEYFWYSAVTVAYEDISLGDVALVAEVSNYSRSKTQQKKLNQFDVEFLISRMVKAPKCQAFCHLSLYMDLEYEDTNDMAGYVNGIGNILDAAMLCDGYSVYDGYMAMKRIAGGVKSLGSDPESRKKLRELIQESDDEYTDLMLSSTYCYFDYMALSAVPLCQYVRGVDVDVTINSEPLKVTHLIRGVPAEALDMHTKIGGSSIRQYYKALMDIPAYQKIVKRLPTKDIRKSLGAIVFIAEGGLIYNAVEADIFTELKDKAFDVFPRVYGCPSDLKEDLLGVVGETLHILNERREVVADSYK